MCQEVFIEIIAVTLLIPFPLVYNSLKLLATYSEQTVQGATYNNPESVISKEITKIFLNSRHLVPRF